MDILLVAYESEGYALSMLARKLQDDGHTVRLLHGDMFHFIDNNAIKDFYAETGFTSWQNYENEYESLYDDEIDPDWEYLREFEETKCANKNLYQLMMTDPIIMTHHHFRQPLMTKLPSHEYRYYWAEKLLKWTERQFRDFDPDLVFSIKRTYFVKNALAQLALTNDVPVLSLVRSRVDDHCHITPGFGYGTAGPIQIYIRDDSDEAKSVREAKEYVDHFRSESRSLYDSESQQKAAKETLYSTSEILTTLLSRYKQQTLHVIQRRKRKYRSLLKGNYFNSRRLYSTLFFTRRAYNRLKYRYRNPFEQSIPTRPFIYFPLHTLPESATLTLSTEYYESDLIRDISTELPAGFILAVKENPNMIGDRPFSFYENLAEIPNVALIDPTVSSKRLIQEGRGVCGVSGTALLEASILDTPTLCFGIPEFRDVISYVGRKDIGDFIAACKRREGALHTDRILRYLQYILDNGRSIHLNTVRNDPGADQFEAGVETIHEMLNREIDALTSIEQTA